MGSQTACNFSQACLELINNHDLGYNCLESAQAVDRISFNSQTVGLSHTTCLKPRQLVSESDVVSLNHTECPKVYQLDRLLQSGKQIILTLDHLSVKACLCGNTERPQRFVTLKMLVCSVSTFVVIAIETTTWALNCKCIVFCTFFGDLFDKFERC